MWIIDIYIYIGTDKYHAVIGWLLGMRATAAESLTIFVLDWKTGQHKNYNFVELLVGKKYIDNYKHIRQSLFTEGCWLWGSGVNITL